MYSTKAERCLSHITETETPMPDEREVAIIPDKERGETWETMYIKHYGSSLDSLIERLIEVRDEIDKQN